jgi:hypothetical protein
VNLPIPVASGPVTIKGLFQGSGTAQLFVRYNTGGGTAFAFPSSVDGCSGGSGAGQSIVVRAAV